MGRNLHIFIFRERKSLNDQPVEMSESIIQSLTCRVSLMACVIERERDGAKERGGGGGVKEREILITSAH